MFSAGKYKVLVWLYLQDEDSAVPSGSGLSI